MAMELVGVAAVLAWVTDDTLGLGRPRIMGSTRRRGWPPGQSAMSRGIGWSPVPRVLAVGRSFTASLTPNVKDSPDPASDTHDETREEVKTVEKSETVRGPPTLKRGALAAFYECHADSGRQSPAMAKSDQSGRCRNRRHHSVGPQKPSVGCGGCSCLSKSVRGETRRSVAPSDLCASQHQRKGPARSFNWTGRESLGALAEGPSRSPIGEVTSRGAGSGRSLMTRKGRRRLCVS